MSNSKVDLMMVITRSLGNQAFSRKNRRVIWVKVDMGAGPSDFFFKLADPTAFSPQLLSNTITPYA